MVDFDMRMRQTNADLPNHRQRPQGIYLPHQAHNKNGWREQDNHGQKQQPHEKQRDPQMKPRPRWREGVSSSRERLQLPDRVLCANFPALKPMQNASSQLGWRRRGIGLDKLKAVCDPSEPRLDSRIADTENLLHLFDRSMTANESRDEDLVFETQPGQLWKLETAFDRNCLEAGFHSFDQPLGSHESRSPDLLNS
jgi:hypothetical protein